MIGTIENILSQLHDKLCHRSGSFEHRVFKCLSGFFQLFPYFYMLRAVFFTFSAAYALGGESGLFCQADGLGVLEASLTL